jgi:hypothetical protein
MSIVPIRKDIGLVKEPLYASLPIESRADVNNQKRGSGGCGSEMVHDIVAAKNNSPVSIGPSRVRGCQVMAPGKQSLTPRDDDTICLDKEIRLEDTYNIDKSFFSLNFDTESLKDRYAIEKIVFNSFDQTINKYTKAQAYRSSSEPVFETFA